MKKKYLLRFVAILFFLSFSFLLYVYIILLNFEYNDYDNYLLGTVKHISDNKLISYLEDNNIDKSFMKYYKEIINSDNLTFASKDNNVYDVYNEDYLLFTIKLGIKKKVNKFGLINYDVLRVKEIKPHLERGIIYYDVVIPSNYKLYVDDVLIKDFISEKEYPNMKFMYDNSDMPKIRTYQVNNLKGIEKIKITNFLDEEVKVEKKGYVYNLDEYVIGKDTYEEALKYLKGEVDVLNMAKMWSLFLTNDLNGNRNGFDNLSNYLIRGSELYKRAYKWATGVDITFTSKHTLDKRAFSNEKIFNFKIYDSNLFSCDVYLEKLMHIENKRQVVKDIMNDTIYFAYEKDGFRMVNIRAIGGSNL